jgi:endonuclease/exonuclease/phosphatase family metal-dependent hydrolase
MQTEQRWIVLLISLFLALSPTAFSTSVETASAESAIKVVSYNIRYGTAKDGDNSWQNRKQIVFDSLKAQAPDLVGLQEALRFQIDEILVALPHFQVAGVGRDDGKSQGEYSAIFFDSDRLELINSSTFWYSDTPKVPGSKSWGNTIPRICTWARLRDKRTSSYFYLFNTHFDHRSQPSRERSAQALIEVIRLRDYQDPVIVTGDFNAGENNPAIQYLKGEANLPPGKGQTGEPLNLVDTFRVLHPNAELVGTFGGFRGSQDGEKIDYVFVTSGAQVLSAEIDHFSVNGRFPSDHYPVTATIILNPGK